MCKLGYQEGQTKQSRRKMNYLSSGCVFFFIFLFFFVFFKLYEVVISRGADTAQKSLSRDNSLHTFTLSHFLWSTGKSTKAMTKYIICQCQRIFLNKSILRRRARYWHQSYQISSHVNISKVSSQNWLRILKRMVDFQWHPLHKILLENFPTEFPRSCISNLQRKHSIRVQGTFRNRSIHYYCHGIKVQWTNRNRMYQ